MTKSMIQFYFDLFAKGLPGLSNITINTNDLSICNISNGFEFKTISIKLKVYEYKDTVFYSYNLGNGINNDGMFYNQRNAFVYFYKLMDEYTKKN